MIAVKLAKLPDRTPVKMNIVLTPALAKRLREYAEFYAETYGVREEVADLVPFILESFLDADSDFRRAIRGTKDSSASIVRDITDRHERDERGTQS